MKDFLELAKRRYSCRAYKADKVREEDLQKILEAGRVSPSAHNNQPYELWVIRDALHLQKLQKAGNFFDPPLVILVCGNKATAWKNSYDAFQSTEVDASIVTDHMMMEATDLGLDTLWVCKFDRQVVRQAFELPSNLEPINMLVIGYGKDTPKSPDRHDKTRKKIEELVHYR
ncbi:MAG: nitroreductase family protein [Treponema sp.]|jgi:nitroreductase|nr:nitroreductase family protein [Treponema sp.]